MDGEIWAAAAVLSVALVLGLATAGDYGLSVDEFNTDDYGPKALAWYTSGFADRSHFETVEAPLWMYGPWFQMLVAAAQSLHLGDPITVRHALTYVAGLAGLAAVVPIARLAVGRWAGLAALVLCLLTGYLYGSLFFTPIDVPFLFAMSWATLAIILMARGDAPSWSASIAAGLFTGLAIATRTGGIITHAYLFGAMALCALAALLRGRAPDLARIALATAVAIALAWMTAIALWPWLQIGNPFAQFTEAYVHFATLQKGFEFPNWGKATFNNALPWWYVPGQLLARLPEGFLALLAIGIGSGAAAALVFAKSALSRARRRGLAGLRAPLLALARARETLVVAVAAFGPLLFLIAQRATLYDGLRHVLFVLPMLAIVAGAGLLRILPVLRRLPLVSGTIAAAYAATLIATMVALHPLEYAAMSALAGGTRGAYGRFELDYWSLAVPAALRRLERRLDAEPRQDVARPRVLVCIPWREHLAGLMFRRDWIAVVDANDADFLIETERSRCAQGTSAVLIDEVKRLDRSFAWIYARK